MIKCIDEVTIKELKEFTNDVPECHVRYVCYQRDLVLMLSMGLN